MPDAELDRLLAPVCAIVEPRAIPLANADGAFDEIGRAGAMG